MATQGWTAERRAAQAARARRLKPWAHSTGPRTAAGKAKVAGNALKTGLHTKAFRDEIREIRAFLRFNRQCVAEYRAMLRTWKAAQRHEKQANLQNKLKDQHRDRPRRKPAERQPDQALNLEIKLKAPAPGARSSRSQIRATPQRAEANFRKQTEAGFRAPRPTIDPKSQARYVAKRRFPAGGKPAAPASGAPGTGIPAFAKTAASSKGKAIQPRSAQGRNRARLAGLGRMPN